MKTRLWLPGVMLALAAACGGAAPGPYVPTEADRAAVQTAGERYVAAFNAQDVAGMAALITEDFERVGANGVHVSGRAEFIAAEEAQHETFRQAGMKLSVSLAEPSYQRWISGTEAMTGGAFTVTGGAPGGPTRGAYLSYAVKGADGAWQFKNQLIAQDPPPPPAPAAAPTTK